MGVSVLILGYSGSGKSTSLRNFEEGEIGIFNVAGKPLPFRKKLPVANRAGYSTIMQALPHGKMRAYVIDDANYLMAFQNFAMARQSGYGKFTEMAVNFEQLLEAANATDDDTIVYFMMHPDTDETGRLKPKSIGKMLDNQLTIEGMFPIVLLAERDEQGFCFITQSDGTTPVKAPMGMFEQARIDNDLKAVDSAIRDYWGLASLTGGGGDE
ncbi:MAG TPA: hypothetical protein IAB86_05365 [Candidatus Aphodovivens avicola]|nr:hypothetical protein [Candidatus Aphodovivens avicola]